VKEQTRDKIDYVGLESQEVGNIVSHSSRPFKYPSLFVRLLCQLCTQYISFPKANQRATMSGIEFTPLLWAIPVAMTALSSYDHRHPFAGQTFKIETAAASPNYFSGGGLFQVFRCGSGMDVIEDDMNEL
jgi:hypothetical protein